MYIWACANGKCQKRDGRYAKLVVCNANQRLMLMKLFCSVRAWRCVRFNKKYAEKLEKKAARKREQEKKAEIPTQPSGPKSNPFSVSAHSNADSRGLTHGDLQLANAVEDAPPFGLGSQIFDATTEEPVPPEPEFDDSGSDTDDDTEDSEDAVDEEAEDLAEALAKTTLNDVYTVWEAMPSYPPVYMSTVSEYLPPEPKAKANIKADDGLGGSKTRGGSEAYENSMHVDEVFSRFTKRVECEGEQCVR